LLEAEFRALFEAAGDAIVVCDEEQRVVLVNGEAEDLFGWSAEEIIGAELQTLIPSRFRPHHRNHCRAFIGGDVARKLMSDRPELAGLRKSGDEFPVEVTLAKVPTETGTLVASIVRDVTERHRMEQSLRERRAELEEMVESKDQLIASISHEIRTPLTSIVGFARLLHDSASELPESERTEMVEMLIQQSGDLTNIVEDLLTVAKADLGKLELTRVSVDLRAQASQVLESLGPDESGPVPLAGETVRCQGDPARVRQIIRNLVVNALRYGGPNVRIEVGRSPEGGYLLVVDDGTGIPEQDRERVFEAYGRGPDLAGLAPSLGLGLYISRSLARLMGGELTYRYVGGESIFELALPIAESG
jgi:protein-histidine pros-kinase